MKLKLAAGIGSIIIAVLASGCADLKYQGETLPATASVKLLKDQEQTNDYRRIGVATISGSYTDYSYEELIQKLSAKARDVGADAFYITEYTVIPVDSVRDDQLFNMTSKSFNLTNDRASNDLNMLERQIDDPTSRIGAKPSTDSKTFTYKRVIRAAFFKKK